MIKDLKKQSIKQNEKTIPQNKNKKTTKNRMEDTPTPSKSVTPPLPNTHKEKEEQERIFNWQIQEWLFKNIY